jgi:hypothetical protein
MRNLSALLRTWLSTDPEPAPGPVPSHPQRFEDQLIELPVLESDEVVLEEPNSDADLRAWSRAFNAMTEGRDLDSPLEDDVVTEPNV